MLAEGNSTSEVENSDACSSSQTGDVREKLRCYLVGCSRDCDNPTRTPLPSAAAERGLVGMLAQCCQAF